MKNKIINLLKSDILEEYINGIELFKSLIDENKLQKEDIDSELIDLIASIFNLEKWAQHKDYLSKVNELHQFLSSNNIDLGENHNQIHLRGIKTFVAGLTEHQSNHSNFIAPLQTGFSTCSGPCERIADYFQEQENEEFAQGFMLIHKFMDKISMAQHAAWYSILEIDNWDSSMAIAYSNRMINSHTEIRDWMMKAIYKQVKDQHLQTHVFDNYINQLKAVKETYADQKEITDEIGELIELAILRSKGN
ncbi:MAG: hypothetical protein N4A49_02005 [Marinifilaceae bacterium]|jgi:Spy/CpxP family protein refolding chaperone|nr:hypothetical protein [Marinifilaceae bacterium]